MKQDCNEVMFLFGAGISIPIGIPAMEGIYKGFMNKKKSGISAKDKKTCDYFTQEMGVQHDLEEFLLAANAIIEFRDAKLNEFVKKNISRTKSSAKIRDYNKNLDTNLKDVKSVRKGILDFLSKVCFQFDREKALKVNAGFVQTLSKLGYSVYSTNYDYAFEYVAIEKDINIIDNFHKSGQRHLWNKAIEFNGDKGFKLIKLHGSVAWYTDADGTIEKIYSPTNINTQGKDVEKIVIVPTRFKDIYEQHFFALYSRFLSSLAQSKVIIIAGHSLRDDYLRAGIIERKRKGNFQVIVIDPTYPTEIKDELPPARKGTIGDILHLPYKWEEIADELSDILIRANANEIANKLLNVYKKHQHIKNKVKIKGSLRKLVISEIKEINVDLKAYLPLNKKPSNLRAWLSATYKDSANQQKNQVTKKFIETSETVYGDKLTGLVDENITLKIKVSNIPAWRTDNVEVKLVVGIVTSGTTSPANVNSRTLIAKDEKLVSYE